ncbi:hypothetical protein [Magnetospirillum aberrantis]|uniref:Lipoprotein n=1 Tax=Magnetospirillum aberrantis SpK TaxID=908842 RepID=A0A7C9QUM5_9PROT|nr:hypothetical protein [Magnetospirillum aberrantis]NFV80985.1 hypothetical protein [Magnetospirillum aberrantis SpK]
MSRWSVCTVVALVSTIALAGCGESKEEILDKAIKKAKARCGNELTDMFSYKNAGIDDERNVEVAAQDIAAKRFEIIVPVYAMSDRFPCYAVIEGDKARVSFKRP